MGSDVDKRGFVKLLYTAFAQLETDGESQSFLGDLCSPVEVERMATRVAIALMLYQGISTAEIIRRTAASETLISHVRQRLLHDGEGYRVVLSKLDPRAIG